MKLLRKKSFIITCMVLVCLNYMSMEKLFISLILILICELFLHENKLKVHFFPGISFYLYFMFSGLFFGAYGAVLYGYALKHIIKDVIYVLFPLLFWIVGQNIRSYNEIDQRAGKECFTGLFVGGVLISMYDLFQSLYRIFTGSISMTSLYQFRSVIGTGCTITLFTLFLYIFMPKNILLKKRQIGFCFMILFADMLIHFSRTLLFSAIVFLFYSGIIKKPVKVIKGMAIVLLGVVALYLVFPNMFGNFLNKLSRSLMEVSVSHTWNHVSIVRNWRGYEVYCELQKFYHVNLFEKLFGGGFGAQLDMKGYAYLVTTEATVPFLHNGYFSILMIWGVVGCINYVFMLLMLYFKGGMKKGENRSFWKALIALVALDTLFVHGPFFSTSVASIFFYLGVLENERGRYIHVWHGSNRKG